RGVANHREAGGRVRVAGDGLLAPGQGVLELVSGEGQAAQPDQRVGVRRRLQQGLVQDAISTAEEARIAGLAGALEVGQAELGGALLVGGVLAQAVLKNTDLAIGGRNAAWRRCGWS